VRTTLRLDAPPPPVHAQGPRLARRTGLHLTEWFEEFRLYHRKDGKVVKEMDDLMSATRYALMMIRFADTPPLPSFRPRHRGRSWMAN